MELFQRRGSLDGRGQFGIRGDDRDGDIVDTRGLDGQRIGALLAIPEGETRTYQAIAAAIDRPQASRAVGTAIGANPIAVLIPCHRAIRETGALGGYYWGLPRKQALLAWESARRLRTLASAMGG